MVAISIPQLDTLDIKPAAVEDRSGGGTCRRIVNRITTYQAPPSCRRLPLLSVGLRQFLECQEFILVEWRLRYMPSPNNPPDSEYDSENHFDNDFEHGEYYNSD